MHPRYKLDYLHSQKWLKEWLKTAEDLARETWNKYYKPTITEVLPDSMVRLHKLCFAYISDQLFRTNNDDPFADVDNFGRNLEEDTFEAYIRSSSFDCGDPIAHWTAKLNKRPSKSKKRIITSSGALARMALDFLSAPGM